MKNSGTFISRLKWTPDFYRKKFKLNYHSQKSLGKGWCRVGELLSISAFVFSVFLAEFVLLAGIFTDKFHQGTGRIHLTSLWSCNIRE